MAGAYGLIERVAPDCIVRLRRAAQMRFEEAGSLQGKHPLAAVYWYGYCVEICLVAAYFRKSGYPPNQPIDRDTRVRIMAGARQKRIMTSDPHPLPGWAMLLRQVPCKSLDYPKVALLNEAVYRAHIVYRHWRPELRYKVADVKSEWLDEVRQAAKWFVNHQSHL